MKEIAGLALSACSSSAFISTRRVESATVALCCLLVSCSVTRRWVGMTNFGGCWASGPGEWRGTCVVDRDRTVPLFLADVSRRGLMKQGSKEEHAL